MATASQNYCKTHIRDREKELEVQLDEIGNQINIFRQTLSEHNEQPNKQKLFQEINQWEEKSISIIRQTAEQNRQLILEETNKHYQQIKIDLKRLHEDLSEISKENNFNETHLNDLKIKLEKLQNQLNNPKNICLKEENSSSFINKIYIKIENRKFTELK